MRARGRQSTSTVPFTDCLPTIAARPDFINPDGETRSSDHHRRPICGQTIQELARAGKLIEQYSTFEPSQLPGQTVNGTLTIGENIGDLGGLTIAHRAYRLSLDGQEPPTIDGLTGDERFFIRLAQVWRTRYRDAKLSRRLATDPHSPAEFRCNGVIRNMPEFYEAFGIREGNALYLPPEERVKIW